MSTRPVSTSKPKNQIVGRRETRNGESPRSLCHQDSLGAPNAGLYISFSALNFIKKQSNATGQVGRSCFQAAFQIQKARPQFGRGLIALRSILFAGLKDNGVQGDQFGAPSFFNGGGGQQRELIA